MHSPNALAPNAPASATAVTIVLPPAVTKDDIDQHLELLATHRRTVLHYLIQQAGLGVGHVPPGITHGLHAARLAIRSIKETLRQWGVAVADHPDDTSVDQSGAEVVDRATVVVNASPGAIPAYFTGRDHEVARCCSFLRDGAQRMLVVVGRGGVGKTTVVTRVLSAGEHGCLPDDLPFAVSAFVYLAPTPMQPLSARTVLSVLTRLLDRAAAERVAALSKHAGMTVVDILAAVLRQLGKRSVVVLLDGFEQALDPATQAPNDPELCELLLALLVDPAASGIKTVITSRVALPWLLRAPQAIGRIAHLDVDGLPCDAAIACLRRMDDNGAGLRAASDQALTELWRRALGIPLVLQSVHMALVSGATLSRILADQRGVLPEKFMQLLIGETFAQLDQAARRVLEILAIFGCPVRIEAVDALLGSSMPDVRSDLLLGRLVQRHIVQHHRESDC